MPTYKVKVTRTVTTEGVVTLAANDRGHAEEEVLEHLANFPDDIAWDENSEEYNYNVLGAYRSL